MANNNIPSSVYLLQFKDGDYLSWFDVNAHYSFGTTSTISQAAIFEKANEVPDWITTYLGGKLTHVNLEVTDD